MGPVSLLKTLMLDDALGSGLACLQIQNNYLFWIEAGGCSCMSVNVLSIGRSFVAGLVGVGSGCLSG